MISGELKPSASPFGVQDEEEEPEVLYDKVRNGFTMEEKICAGPLGSTGDASCFNGTTVEPLLKALLKGRPAYYCPFVGIWSCAPTAWVLFPVRCKGTPERTPCNIIKMWYLGSIVLVDARARVVQPD